MDAFKRQCVSEEQKIDAEDIISGLPDVILQHILSFLETKDAVQTAILSRRWRYLWTGIPVLDFDDTSLYPNQNRLWYSLAASRFMNFVERVLLLRDKLDIKRFRLSCCVFFSASRIHSWISSAVRHKVQELDLCLSVEEKLLLPHSVFSSSSLTYLKLYMNCNLQLPNHISFPSLKILHLGLLAFENDKSVEKLFACCPLLEELAIIDCDWKQLKSIAICIPSLRSLIIDDLPLFDPAGDSDGCAIKINAAKLSSFKYSGYLTNDIRLSNLLTSVKASIHIPIAYQLQDKIAPCAVKLFEKLKNAYSLKISNSTIESLFQVNVLDHLPIFQQLTHLELTMNVSDQTLGSLLKFLGLLPKLEFLHFAKGIGSHLHLHGDGAKSRSATNCLLSSLKIVNIHNFSGNDSEICLLKTLLKSAPCLERINLFNSPSGKFKAWGDLRNQLEKFPSGAKHCAVTIF